MALEQIGQKLKVAREGQGLTLAQIYERTKIPINHLQAIDTGVTDDLPEPVYVAGFIKRYAECVGLNGQNLSDEYRKQATPERVGGGESSGWGGRSNVAQPVLMPAPQLQRARIDDRPPSFMKTLFYPACWIVLVLALITFLVKMQGNDNGGDDKTLVRSLPQSKFDKIQPANAPETASQTGPTTNAQVAATPATTPAATPSDANLSITASQHVWVDIKAMSTGETLYIGNLEAGDRRDYKDPQGIRIVSGNGASVTIDMDGKTSTMGPAGRRAEKVYLSKNAQTTTGTVAADGTIKPGAGNVLSTLGTSAIKPPVKRIKKPVTDIPVAPRRRFRPVDDGSSHSGSGDSLGSGRSVDVPYRYTEGRDSGE
ncbi:MAG TPA: RodZ domain-containing protein [Drouetiella sp.]